MGVSAIRVVIAQNDGVKHWLAIRVGRWKVRMQIVSGTHEFSHDWWISVYDWHVIFEKYFVRALAPDEKGEA
jgi:membrane-associated PAP2 superfamily phosphatase